LALTVDVEEKGYARASFMGSLWEVRRRDMVMTGWREERSRERERKKDCDFWRGGGVWGDLIADNK
jgi:hypothetical protein